MSTVNETGRSSSTLLLFEKKWKHFTNNPGKKTTVTVVSPSCLPKKAMVGVYFIFRIIHSYDTATQKFQGK